MIFGIFGLVFLACGIINFDDPRWRKWCCGIAAILLGVMAVSTSDPATFQLFGIAAIFSVALFFKEKFAGLAILVRALFPNQ